jgi:Beta-propeller repeat/Secretion system C-terminal sorting domain
MNIMKTTLLFLILTISIFAGNEQIQDQLNRINKNFFIENKGQWPSEVKYLAKVGGMNAWITNSGVVYDYFRITKNYNESETLKMARYKKEEFEKKNTSIKGHVVKMQLVNINTSSVQQGNNKQEGYYNYFIGNDKSKWVSYVPLYGDVEQDDIYKSINVKYYFDGNSIRYDYIVKPEADLSQLKLKFEGQESIRVNDAGELVSKTSLGEVTNGKLYSYQIDNGIKTEVSCKFVQNVDGTISLNAAGYDRNNNLIIDPLVYSTFIGGNNDDSGKSIAIDAGGNAYITGYTSSTNFDTTLGAYQTTYGGNYDAFVTKLNSAGSALVYSTFIGGNGSDYGSSIAINAGGNAYITGYTSSTNFNTTLGAYQTTFGGGYSDVFVTKLNSTGTALVYSTYIGGGIEDYGYSIAIDVSGNAYITGSTSSSDYPATSGAYKTNGCGNSDAFVTKLNSTGSSIVYSTFIGGSQDDGGNSIAIDASGNAYITGSTSSSNYPILGAYQTTFGGGYSDAFVTKLNSTGSALVYSTFIGGSGDDGGNSIAIDASGNAYITGSTSSTNFDTTSGAYQTTFGGTNDAFVTKISPSGSALIYSTFIGGSSNDFGNSITIDDSGNVYITGYTGSSDYPTTSGAYQSINSGGSWDAFVTKLNSSGSALVYSTFIGGSSSDNSSSIAIDVGGNAYITGNTNSLNYPATTGAYQTTNDGSYNAFVTKLPTADDPLPVQLTNFSAEQDKGNVLLKWETKSEIQNAGFDIERKTAMNEQFIKIGFIKGSGNCNTPKQYSFADNSSQGGKISYRLCQINTDGLVTYSNEIEVAIIPSDYILYQNYPNPFNPSTVIKYSLPFESKVNIKFYNSIGQCVREVNEGNRQPGYYELNFNSSGLASGVYFYTIKSISSDGKNNFMAVKKMMVLK